jgi:hypothetical protein
MQYKGATQQLIPRIASAGNKKILSREGGEAVSSSSRLFAFPAIKWSDGLKGRADQ